MDTFRENITIEYPNHDSKQVFQTGSSLWPHRAQLKVCYDPFRRFVINCYKFTLLYAEIRLHYRLQESVLQVFLN